MQRIEARGEKDKKPQKEKKKEYSGGVYVLRGKMHRKKWRSAPSLCVVVFSNLLSVLHSGGSRRPPHCVSNKATVMRGNLAQLSERNDRFGHSGCAQPMLKPEEPV